MPFLPSDPDLEALERRATQLHELTDCPSLEAARARIAAEHGEDGWSSLCRRLEQLLEGTREEPFWSCVRAIRAGDAATLAALVGARPGLLEERGTHGHTLLGIAARAVTGDRSIPLRPGVAGTLEAARTLIEAGIDPSAAAEHGWSPLHTAAMSGHDELCDLLLEAGASVETRLWGIDGGTAGALALFYAQSAIGARLVDLEAAPANLRTAGALGRREEIEACFAADGTMLPRAWAGRGFYRPLLLFPDWSPRFEPRQTLDEALLWTARHGHLECLEALVDRGADVNACPYSGTPLTWAVYTDCVPALRWLIEHGADPNLRHDFGGRRHGKDATALHLAAQYGCLGSIRTLLEAGADPTIRDGLFDGTPLDWARYAGAEDAIRLLSRAGG